VVVVKVVVEAALAKGAITKLVVIELNNSDDRGDDKDAYTAFKVVKVEDKVIEKAI
jgi:hypothetical protein